MANRCFWSIPISEAKKLIRCLESKPPSQPARLVSRTPKLSKNPLLIATCPLFTWARGQFHPKTSETSQPYAVLSFSVSRSLPCGSKLAFYVVVGVDHRNRALGGAYGSRSYRLLVASLSPNPISAKPASRVATLRAEGRAFSRAATALPTRTSPAW